MEEAEVSGEAIGRIRGVVQNSGELPLVWFGLDARDSLDGQNRPVWLLFLVLMGLSHQCGATYEPLQPRIVTEPMNRTERFYKIDQMLHERHVVPIDVFLEVLDVSRATFKRNMEYHIFVRIP